MVNPDWLDVEVVFADKVQQQKILLKISSGSTIEEAILKSQILEKITGFDLAAHKVGIFGKIVRWNTS